MTLRDLSAEMIHAQMSRIETLSRVEREAEEARRARRDAKDQTERRRAADELRQKEDEAVKLRKQLLAAADPTVIHAYLESTNLESTKVADPDAFRTAWQNASRKVDARKSLRTGGLEALWDAYLATPTLDLAPLPPYSFSVQFTFTLAKPYMSKDDNPFYIIDNPIVRDKVFRLPLVRPSSWKGSLCAALWQLGHRRENDDPQIKRLFGEARADDSGQAGRLVFFPTFFDATSLEIINPHDRQRKVGKNPILLECVPPGATGVFSLLYVPFDRIGRDEAEARAEVVADLPLVAEALQAMLTTYGFGAKTSSGFGVAQETIKGTLTVRATLTSQSTAPAARSAEPSLAKYLAAPGQLKAEYLNPDGTFRERTEAELSKMTNPNRKTYKNAKGWWEREGKALASQPPAPAEPPPPPAPVWASCTFTSFDDLSKQLSGEKDNDVATALGVKKPNDVATAPGVTKHA